MTALRSAIDTQFRQWISRLKRENLSNFFNRYINFSRWLKSFLISRYYKMQKKKKRNHRYPINRSTILGANPPNIEIFVQALPPFTRRFSFPPHSSLRPYSLSIHPLAKPLSTTLRDSRVCLRDPPTVARLAYASILRTGRGEEGGRFLQRPGVRHIFAGEH